MTALLNNLTTLDNYIYIFHNDNTWQCNSTVFLSVCSVYLLAGLRPLHVLLAAFPPRTWAGSGSLAHCCTGTSGSQSLLYNQCPGNQQFDILAKQLRDYRQSFHRTGTYTIYYKHLIIKKTFLTPGALIPFSRAYTCQGLSLWCSVLSCQIDLSVVIYNCVKYTFWVFAWVDFESRFFTAFKIKIQPTFHLNSNGRLFSQ